VAVAQISPPQAGFRAAWLTGFALAGFFDGILLHQILQWHHLLSLVRAPGLADPRAQILADGLFHVAMYLLALAGLALFWKERRGLATSGSGRTVLAGLLAGFGVWNIVDAVLFHWVLRLHHIRLDTPSPVTWDVIWLVAFGLLPLALSLAVGRSSLRPPGSGAAAAVALLVVISGVAALRSPPGGFVTALFRPGLTPAQTFDAIAASGGLLVATDASGQVVVMRLPPGASRWRLYAHGALVVGGAGPAGCLAWTLPTRSI
jgi:uncharacterized membrane protein